ncbi:Cyclic nucleotide-binding and metallo-beta-lactamase domains-containing protein [Desulfonema limicola]|uniref:Cyclic nucleotide-binding and metallo-beta-lactamase domains-containing protein n=1 Tax=Desulfonema limicola TaxID=45656 RepID=A0A975GJW5_9BACT|nr:cyclic nucleotide-binding domain-containing protein [Desulfonema limicola]QTA83982.1 Cyclic nucleotide-binding and metallo-beta-lactamase domains-containing protein [Desulfonema limicola]
MTKIGKYQVSDGLFLVEIPDAGLQIQCGCPADSVKHLMKRGLIVTKEKDGVIYETGPNVVLLSDVLVQNGSFANLAEFPVLQMLYRQGMILPNHPNNTGIKPMLVGIAEQVEAQIQYIYRGNYGLVSEEEIISTGISPETAHEMMRLKLKFAFGRISPANELLDTCIVESEPVEIRNRVYIRRLRLNVFEIQYKDEKVIIDLNLAPHNSYSAPYPLGFNNIKREYFAVIHSGEGDGWNVNRPCMSSILMFQGKIYLIDAGPNVLYSLTALGIGVNEIEGIFHTHAHDDHIAGFTMLMRSDHRIKYYAAPLVRKSVAKKLSVLMSIPEDNLFDYFQVCDLDIDVWNNIEGLEVKPVFSPHPVETTILIFRSLWEDGYPSYAHFADIVSLKVLKGMITDDESKPGISQEYYDRVKKIYLEECHIKKLDVGGGLIHGDAKDFTQDLSEKIILSHTSDDLTDEQKEIGSGAPFGMVDVLIPTVQNYLHTYARNFLRSYFPTAPSHELSILLNNDMVTFNPHSILIKNGIVTDEIYLLLTGNVERIQSELGIHSFLSAGALIGETSALDSVPCTGTYRAANFVRALRLPRILYFNFVKRNNLYTEIKKLQHKREFLQQTSLFGEVVSYPTQNDLAKAMQLCSYLAGQVLPETLSPDIFMVKCGKLEKFIGNSAVETLRPGFFFGEEIVLFNIKSTYQIRVIEDSDVYQIPGNMLLDIPVVRWKLFETYQKRLEIEVDSAVK